MAVSDFERQRRENIARNKELLRKLNLDTLSNDIYTEVKGAEESKVPKKRKAKPKPRVKKPIVPIRRSSRIAGISIDDTPEGMKAVAEADKERQNQLELERLKNVRLSGDIKLSDIISDQHGIKKTETDEDLLEKFRDIGKSFSMGDFYETISKKQNINDQEIVSIREEFDGKNLLPNFDPLDVKLTPQRITSINFHPSVSKRLVIAGDTGGHMGIWSVDDSKPIDIEGDDGEEDNEESNLEPEITILKNHGKTVSKILSPANDPTKIITASYDGSIRSIDMNNMNSAEIINFDDQYGDAVGISDINMCPQNPNLIFFTTLNGQFATKDLRQAKKLTSLRLHDKKIGSFSVNPQSEYQISSASLDRSLRLWDLRNISRTNWSSFTDEKSPHCYGSYSSRLSISCSDWNSSGRIVCNGYDDSITLFNVSDSLNWKKTYQMETIKESVVENIPINMIPIEKIKHNCQTGRWVSILKSKWQQNPKDGVEKFVIGNMNRSIDVFTQDGVQIGHLTNNLVGAVPAVVAFHPTENWVVGGSASGKGYLFE